MTAPHDHDNLGGSNRYISLAKAAALLDVPPRKLQRHRARWGIPAYPLGNELRFRERDIHAWMAKRRVAA